MNDEVFASPAVGTQARCTFGRVFADELFAVRPRSRFQSLSRANGISPLRIPPLDESLQYFSILLVTLHPDIRSTREISDV